MRRSLVVIALAGCGRLAFDPFGAGTDAAGPGDGGGSALSDASIDAPSDAAIDAPIDARVIVPVSSTVCTPATPATTFPGPTPCTDWMAAVTASGTTVTETGGALAIAPSSGMASAFGQCGRSFLFDAPGLFAEVSDVVDGASSTTLINVSGGGENYVMAVSNGSILAQHFFGTIVMVPYDPVAMRWWRMRPITSGVLYETSPDASTWTLLATSNRPSSQMLQVTLFGGVAAAETLPGSARFEAVNVCP